MQVIARQNRGRGRAVMHERRRSGHVVGERVATNDQFVGRVLCTLGADGNGSVIVFAVRSFFHRVVLHQQIAAIRNVDQIARIACRAIGNIIANKDRAQCARFDVVTLVLIEKARMFDVEQLNFVDIDAVRALWIALAVAMELAVEDAYRAAGDNGRQHAVLIIDEVAVVYGEVMTFRANPCAIAIRRRGARKRQVPNRDVVAINDEDSLPGAGLARDRCTGAAALNGQSAGTPDCAVSVFTRSDTDGVALSGDDGSLTWEFQFLRRPYIDDACGALMRGAGNDESQNGPGPNASHANHHARVDDWGLYNGMLTPAKLSG